jgi:hypothetical protein
MITHLQQLTRYRAICCEATPAEAMPPASADGTDVPPARAVAETDRSSTRTPAQHVAGIVQEDYPPFRVISESVPPGNDPIP